MFRVVSSLVFASALLLAFTPLQPVSQAGPFAVNSTEAHAFVPTWRAIPEYEYDFEAPEADTSAVLGVLMFQYASYDANYSEKVQDIVRQKFPQSDITEFNEGTPEDLSLALRGRGAVVLAYPSTGQAPQLKAYGAVLKRFAQQGGIVIATGTHEYAILQQLGLFDLDYGYFCAEPVIHLSPTPSTSGAIQQQLLAGLPAGFSLKDYAYPLDISDPNFVTVADVKGYPVAGYKVLGSGKIFYLGLEFYNEEAQPATLMANALRFARFSARTFEYFIAGSGNRWQKVSMSVYPNPYVEKANLDLELEKGGTAFVEVVDLYGKQVALLLPKRNLSAQLYRFELPSNIPAGTYFVRCWLGERMESRQVQKLQTY